MKILSIWLIVLGAPIHLFGVRLCIGRLFISKEQGYSLLKYAIDRGRYPKDTNIDILYQELLYEGYLNASIEIGVGLLLVLTGLFLLNKYSPIKTSNKEVIIHLIYWLLFMFLVGFVVSGGGAYISQCTVDWIYFFLVAGLVGFYFSYAYLYHKYVVTQKWLSFFYGSILFAALGCSVSYLPLDLWNAYKLGFMNYQYLFHIQHILALGFFSFIAFIHVYIAVGIKGLLLRL